ncbi:dipeptide epimerase [Pedosphaera parvula]|uniref:Dipeptide epimerase n=1 Tax=Pedosphaera parvula (strain Ellin514) TaxID=320771 RepID=B9XIJ4_PEDPL|nr:dipeptide epimerase [Pedosphaera parvula]EEF60257.1 Mandelate racemase/muconate lactonizing protein [Pedosphaera parvula Ellin514]
MQIKVSQFGLNLAHAWATAASSAKKSRIVTFVKLTSSDGAFGFGESAPSSRYGETLETVTAFLAKIDPKQLSFDDVPGSMAYLDKLSSGDFAAKAAVNIALWDGAGKKARKPIYDLLGLGFTENKHITSYTIGIDAPEIIRQKVLEAEQYPVLKLKVGDKNDRETMAILRSIAPAKTVRIDGNEGWKTKEEALKNIEWFAQDKNIEFVEQPMPADSNPKDLAWLKERSPLPLYADESFFAVADVSLCVDCFHGVNVKLVKTAGISGAYEALQAAKKAGLKRMIGCMVESSVLIGAGAHLAELADHLDIDTNLLITNDPFQGTTAEKGIISFAKASEPCGLRVKATPSFVM